MSLSMGASSVAIVPLNGITPGGVTIGGTCTDTTQTPPATQGTATTTATVVKATLVSVGFTSDHGLLKKTPTAVWDDSDVAMEKPEWVPASSLNNPISQTKNTNIALTATVKVEPAGVPFDMVGIGAADYVTFPTRGTTSTGANQEVNVTSNGKLPNQVCTLSKSINWKINIGTAQCGSAASGPHKIYVTYGTPGGSSVTEKRIETVCSYANGKSALKECADAVFDHTPARSAYGDAPPLGPTPIWRLYVADPNVPKTQSQCPGIANFVGVHFQMLGLGAGKLKYCYAKPDGTYFADDDPNIAQSRVVTIPPHPDNTTHKDIALLEKLIMFRGGANAFQAAYLFNNYYYTLGFGRTYTTAKEVVKAVFGNNIYWEYQTSNDFPPTWSKCDEVPWIEAP